MQPNEMFQPSAPQGPPSQLPPFQPQPQQSPQNNGPVSAAQQKSQKPLAFIIIVAVLAVMFIAALVLGLMMMSSRNDFRDNTQAKIDAAVEKAVAESKAVQEAEFVEREKQPYKTYTGPVPYGTLTIDYPKTWAAYIEESNSGNRPIDGYMHPNFVPDVNSDTSFALRFEVIESSYEEELNKFSSDVRRGNVTVKPITLEKVPSVPGSRIDGEVENDKQGSVVLFPLRDKTIKVSVLSDQYLDDFDNIILKHMSFVP